MRLYLAPQAALKRLETPAVYDIASDDLYELDEDGFAFFESCARPEGCEAEGGDFINYCLGAGILTDHPAAASRPPVAAAPTPSLRYLELQITARCNLRCGHCYLGPGRPVDLPAGAVIGLIEEFERMQGLRVLITGGEPLLHTGFELINDALRRFAVRKILLTNGTLLTRERISRLAVSEIQVSIDGLRDSHDSLRGQGSYDKAMRAIENAVDLGMSVSISTMVHKGNLGDFGAMDALFRGLGVRDWTVDAPVLSGNLRSGPSPWLPPEIAGKYLTYGYGEGLHGGAEGHVCGYHLMAITADGLCAKCGFYADRPVGRIGDGLAACWSRIEHPKVAALECDCGHLEACRGGCRYRAAILGSATGRDLYKCFSYGYNVTSNASEGGDPLS